MTPLSPNEQRAKNAITLIWIVLVLEIISLISGYFQYELLNSISNGNEVSPETANANDTREQIIGIVYIIVYIISGVTFIQWFRRAYFNLHQLSSNLSYSEGWASGSWFVPVVNLFRPLKIMKELYRETQVIIEQRGFSAESLSNTGSLNFWWTLWILNAIVGQVSFRISMSASTVDDYIASTVASIIGNIISIPLALITIRVIKNYSVTEVVLNEIPAIEEAVI